MDRYSFCSNCALASALAIGVLISVAVAASAAAEGFRIETKVFVGKDKEPTSTTTTLFLNGMVYDFLSSPDQIAVFQSAAWKQAGAIYSARSGAAGADGIFDGEAERRDGESHEVGVAAEEFVFEICGESEVR